jgi:preprotein translocase subunit YajC
MVLLSMMAPPAGEGANPFAPLLMVGIIFVIFYFLLIRPQHKQQKKHQTMIANLKKGDRVVTSGGIYGKVVGVHENLLTLQIAKDVTVELQKSAVSSLASTGEGNGKE